MSDRPPKPRRKSKLQPTRIDTTTRELLADNPPAWVAYMGVHAGRSIQVMDSNVASTAAGSTKFIAEQSPHPRI